MKQLRIRKAVTFFAVSVLLGLASFGPGFVAAQDAATPIAGEHNHPAHVHTGTCDAVGEVVYALNNVAAATDDGSPAAEETEDAASPEASMENEEAHEDTVAESTTTLTTTFEQLTAADHVINIHESEENIGTYITCGAITGEVENAELELELSEMNGSGWEGEAELYDNGDGTIDVTIRLKAVESGDGMATPEASPEA